MYQIENEICSQYLVTLGKYFEKEGPEDSHSKTLHRALNDVYDACKNGKISVADLETFKAEWDIFFDEASMIGHVRMRPYGYAGDFLIIDRFLSFRCIKEKYRKWDSFSYHCSAGQTLRNRKDYFKSLVKNKINGKPCLRVLNLASGPCRDIYELFEEFPDIHAEITCVDMDNSAIQYAQNLLGKHAGKVTFVHKNIFRFDTENKYDLIWSAGMFDYFQDKAFVRVLSKMKQWLAPAGELAVGNFNERHNPSRAFMEVLGGWCLHHRKAEELVALGLQAGFSPAEVQIKSEGENINLFLHCKA